MVGLLFQPRRRPANTRAVEAVPDVDVPGDRRHVFQLALEATMLGDTSRFADYFTDDLRLTSPHVEVTTRDAAQRAFGGGDDALSCMAIVVHAIDVVRDTAYAEWRLDAKFSAPLLFDDDLLIEPTGGAVRLRGSVGGRVPRAAHRGVSALLRRQRAARRTPRRAGARALGAE